LIENRLRWFGHVERRPVDVVVRRVDQMEESRAVKTGSPALTGFRLYRIGLKSSVGKRA